MSFHEAKPLCTHFIMADGFMLPNTYDMPWTNPRGGII